LNKKDFSILISRSSEAHAISLWILGGASIFIDTPILNTIVIGLIISFAIIAFPGTRTSLKILSIAILLATTWIALFYEVEGAIIDGLERAAIFPAFLATLVLLRATADHRPESQKARQAFSSLPKTQRAGGIVTGAHFIGAILQVGVFAVLAPIIGRDSTETDRRGIFLIAARGMALVPFWSPFVVGMAIASEYLPNVPLWQPVLLGLILTVIGLLVSAVIMDGERKPAVIWRTLLSLGPIIPGVFLTAALVVVTSILTGWSTLQSLVISLPIPCLVSVFVISAKTGRQVLSASIRGVGRIGPEVTIMTCAIILGTVFEAAMPQSGILNWLQSLKLSPISIILIVIMGMTLAGLMGIHAIVPGTMLLVLFVNLPSEVADLILMQALLVGWGLCTLISLGSLTIITGSIMFNLNPLSVITGPNIAYAFGLGLFCAAVLVALNSVLMS